MGPTPNYRAVHVGRTLLEACSASSSRGKGYRPRLTAPPLPAPVDQRNLLNALVLNQPMDKKAYETQLEKLQGRLALAVRSEAFARRSLVLVFEGMDAAGKGGAIRRVTQALDTRQYAVIPDCGPERRGACPALPLAFLAALAAGGQGGHLRSLLVRPGAG
jgi:hypothetical protein